MSKIWDNYLTDRDKIVLSEAGYGARQGFGQRPALLIVDMNYGFVGDKPEPILDSIKRWMNSCGDEGWGAIEVTKTLLRAARDKGLPVIYTTSSRRQDGWDQGIWAYKNSRVVSDFMGLAPTELKGNVIVADIAPGPQDIVIAKQKPSAFFATELASYLVHLRADSLFVVGTTTSGCVRATVLDAFSYNFRVAVVEDGCADRCQASHAMSLCDMDAKYADVVQSAEVLDHIRTLPGNLFELPAGDPTAGREFSLPVGSRLRGIA